MYVTLGIVVGVKVVSSSETASTVIGLSSLPINGLSILARTPFGRSLQARTAAARRMLLQPSAQCANVLSQSNLDARMDELRAVADEHLHQ